MTFGRPASIPGAYSRLEQPSYYDSIEPWPRQPWQLQRCRHSTDFFCATKSVVPSQCTCPDHLLVLTKAPVFYMSLWVTQ